jgi:hypothetical protein
MRLDLTTLRLRNFAGTATLLLSEGFLSPDVDDVLRLVIVFLSALNVLVLLVTVLTLRQVTRILLDIEQFAREVRRRTRRAEEPVETDL